MNTLVIVLIAAVCLLAGYTCYGRWLANKWGIDPNAKPRRCCTMTGRTMCLRTAGPYFPISFHPSRGRGL